MNSDSRCPTAFPEVNTLLRELLLGLSAILGDRVIGVYLHGSLVFGGFDLRGSDIDFLVVIDGEVSEHEFDSLRLMHERIAASGAVLATELEGSYITKAALRRHNPENATHPNIERGGSLAVRQHYSDWVIQRHVLREHGQALVGPHPTELIDPIEEYELRSAVLEVLTGWWVPMLDDPVHLQDRGYRAYAVLTMCRILYTLEHGTVVSKPTAGHWAMERLPDRWAILVNTALAWPVAARAVELESTLAFIQYAAEQAVPVNGVGNGKATSSASRRANHYRA